jgi:hypothetical protein
MQWYYLGRCIKLQVKTIWTKICGRTDEACVPIIDFYKLIRPMGTSTLQRPDGDDYTAIVMGH